MATSDQPEGQRDDFGFGDFGQSAGAEPPPGGYPQPGWYPPPPGYQPPTTGWPGGYGPAGYGPGGYGPAGYLRPKTNGAAIGSLVCGLAQFPLWFLLVPGVLAAIAALILGLVSIGQIKRRGEAGRGMAIAGVVLGALGILFGIFVLIVVVILAPRFSHLNDLNNGVVGTP